MKENKQYKLVGIFNDYDYVPSVVYPLFQDKKGNYYGAFCDDNSPYISEFQLFPVSDTRKRIKQFTKTNNIFEIEPDKYLYQVGDLAICGLQTTKKNVYIGTIDKYLEYAKNLLLSIETKIDSYTGEEKMLMEYFVRELKEDIEDYEGRVENIDKPMKKHYKL